MVDKDDLFQEEDGTDPQGNGGDEPSSDGDDEIIDLFDTVEIPADAIEEDIIELSDTVETSEDEILELTEEAQPSLVDDDVPDSAKVVTGNEANDFLDTIEMPGKDIGEDVIELADIVLDTDPEALDITQELEPEADDKTIDLTEPVIEDTPEDKAINLLDTIEMPGKDIEEDIIELLDTVETSEDEILELTEEAQPSLVDDDVPDTTKKAVTGNEVNDFLDTIEMSKDDMFATDLDDNNLDAVDMVDSPTAEEETLGDIFNPAETVDEERPDQAVMDQIGKTEPMEPGQEVHMAETATPPSVGYEEDKELLELIDDIQATLNDEPLASNVDDRKDITEKDEAVDTGTRKEDAESYIFFEDEEFMGDKNIPPSETEFADHLGIDLTDVKPAEAIKAGFGPGSLEAVVKQALTEMLADKNNPLVKAIENAVKKALSQGDNT